MPMASSDERNPAASKQERVSRSVYKGGAKRSTASSSSAILSNKKDEIIINERSRCGKQRRSRAVPRPHVTKLYVQDKEHFKRTVHRFTGKGGAPYNCVNITSPPVPPTNSAHAPSISTTTSSSLAQFPSASCSEQYNDPLAAGRSAIAQSLRSTLHIISACLQLLNGSSQRPVDAATSSIPGLHPDLEAAHKSKSTVALLQELAVNQYSESRHKLGGRDGPISYVLANPSTISACDSTPSVDLASTSLQYGGHGDPKPSSAVQNLHIDITPHIIKSSPNIASGLADFDCLTPLFPSQQLEFGTFHDFNRNHHDGNMNIGGELIPKGRGFNGRSTQDQTPSQGTL